MPEIPKRVVNHLMGWVLWAACVTAGLLLACLLAELYAVASRSAWPLARDVLASWQVPVIGGILLGLLVWWGRQPTVLSALDPRSSWYRWLAGVAVLAVLVLLRSPVVDRVNAFGLVTDPPSASLWTDGNHPTRPRALVTTNRHGFRDDPWPDAPPDGATRVLVVGDSYVYGKGIPEESGLFDRQLESALGRLAPKKAWEVLNGGYPGWGYFSYFDAARRMAEALRPRIIVISSLGDSDWSLFDYQQQLEIFGAAGFSLAAATGLAEDLHVKSVLHTRRQSPSERPGAAGPGAENLIERVDRLLDTAERLDAHVVVWEWYEPFPFFERFRDRPRFHIAGWPLGFPRGWNGWGKDPTLAVPGDFHPTGVANALMAKTLAPMIVELLAGQPTDPSARGSP